MEFRALLHLIWKVPLGMGSWFFGLMVGGMILPVLGLSSPVIPEGVEPITVGVISLFMSLFIVLSGAMLATQIDGSYFTRWLSLSLLILVAYGVNNALEGALFTTIASLATPQNILSIIILQVFPSFTIGGIIVLLFKPESPSTFKMALKKFSAQKKISTRISHILLTIGAFVVIYWGIGVIISPLVTPIYIAGDFELVLPPLDQILFLQVVRGTLLTITLLPFIITWKSTSQNLLISLGIALTVLLGLFPLSLAYWISLPVRAIHTIEILVDSLLYGAVIVYLFRPSNLKNIINGNNAARFETES
jgi:hypothetical protein